MKSYKLRSFFFNKRWVWFGEPMEVNDVDSVTFFSYADINLPGFKKKEGWTTVIDLKGSEEDTWKLFRPGFIAEQIKKGYRKGIEVKVETNFDEFRKLYKDFREKKGIPEDDFRVFEEHGVCFIASFERKPVAGGVFIFDENTMRAWALASRRLNGADGKTRDLIGQANRIVIWEAIKYAKKKGMSRFDLGGIEIFPDGSPPPLTQFKEAFGGERVKNYYYTKVYSPVLRFFHRVKSVIRK